TFRERSGSRASTASPSISCRHPSSCRGAWSGPTSSRECRLGRIGCSSSSPRTPPTRRAISGSPPTALWRSAPKSRCDRFDCLFGTREPVPIGHVASRPGHLPLGVAPRFGLGLRGGLLEAAHAGEVSPQFAYPVRPHGGKAVVETERQQGF